MTTALEFPFADIAAALKVQANEVADRANDIEQVAIQIGVSERYAAHCVAKHRRQADLIAHAHHIFLALMPVERTVRAVIAAGEC